MIDMEKERKNKQIKIYHMQANEEEELNCDAIKKLNKTI